MIVVETMDKLKSFGESFRRKRDSVTLEDQQQQWQSSEQNLTFPIKYIGSLEVTASKGMPICGETTSPAHSSADLDAKSKIGSVSIHSKESLNECLIELVDASECYANAGYYKRSYNCERQAKLIALQLALRESTEGDVSHMSTNNQQLGNNNNTQLTNESKCKDNSIANVLNLSITEPQELVNTIIGLESFEEAYIVAEAYDYHLVWHRALFNNVILRGSTQYLEEFCQKCDLSESIITDLVVLYKQYLTSASNDNELSADLRNSGGRRRSSMLAPGGSNCLATSSSSSLLLGRQSPLGFNTVTPLSAPRTLRPAIVKPPKATFSNDDTDDNDKNEDVGDDDHHKAKNDDDALNDDDIANGGVGHKNRVDDNCKVNNKCNMDTNKVGDADVVVDVDPDKLEDVNNDNEEGNKLARLASSMQMVLERLANVRLRFKIYSDLNFTDAKEELASGRNAAITAYLKDLKLA